MMYSDVIKEKITTFHHNGIPPVFERDLSLGDPLLPAQDNLVQVITGVRRCGKTYRLYQEIKRLVKDGVPLNSILYFNFEDERLKPYTPELLHEVVETFFSLNPHARIEGAYFFFDEIQEVPEWGLFLRRMVDTQRVTIYVTGSSSKMLSSDLSTEFRGRALTRELFPMSFAEYARFHGVDLSTQGQSRADSLRYSLENYLVQGGFIATQQLTQADSIQLLQEYALRTVNKDVIERYGLRNTVVATQFISRCLASSGRELSINKIAQTMKSAGMQVSRATLTSLLSYYEEAYLVFSLHEFSRALSQNPKSVSKLYAVDPAMQVAFSPSAALDNGQRLETAVYNKLRRESGQLRAGALSRALVTDAGKRVEVDFVKGDTLLGNAFELIQVATSLEEEATRSRELRATRAGMRVFDLCEATLVTLNEHEDISVDEGVIHVVPAWEWLL